LDVYFFKGRMSSSSAGMCSREELANSIEALLAAFAAKGVQAQQTEESIE
jgi:hypothetical protein